MATSAWQALWSLLGLRRNTDALVEDEELRLWSDSLVLNNPQLLADGYILRDATMVGDGDRNAVEISSLRDLPIARPYVTPQGTALIRQNQREVVLGKYMESRHGGVIFIVVPQTQAEEGCELGPTSSRRAMRGRLLPCVLEVALERFLGKSLKKGLVFCDFEMKSGTRVTELPGLLIPGTKYVSEDNRVELLLTSTDKRITFRFCPEAKILPAEQFKKTLYSASYISQIQIGSRKRMREHAPSYELMPFPPAPRSPEHFIDLGPMCPQSSSFGYEHPLASSPMTYGTARSAAFPTCFACQREGSAANHHRHRFLSDRDDHDDDSQPSKRQRVHDSDASSSSTSSTLVAADAIDEEGSAPPPPPPPMMLPPPPPPPPMLNRSKDQNAKRLRPLRWSSIPAHKLESTVWARKDVPSIPSTGSLISQHEVESLFSISPIKRSLDSVERTKAHSLIDIKRSNNIAITLTQFSHMSFDQIKDCLLLKSASSSSDTAPPKLTIDNLAALQMIFPITPEERRVLLIKAGVADTLPIAERFLIHFLDVMNPELKARVQLFMKTFDMQTAELAEDLDAILTACDQVQRTERLPQLLRIILVLGSVLNRDTYLNTCGFRLQSLRKLGETRTRRKGHTALNYLAKVAHDYNPAILSFADDLPQCVQASEIDLDDLAASVRALTAGMELVVSELEADLADSNNAGMPDSPYAEALRTFYARSNDTLSSLQQQLLQAQSTFAKVSEYFGEDSGADQIKSTDFFSILTEFSDSLLAAHRVNQLEQEQERKKAAAAAALAAKQAAELEAQEQAQQVQEQEPLGDDDASSVEKENCQRVDKQYTAEQRRTDGSLVTLAQ